jgi:hypothetical protein
LVATGPFWRIALPEMSVTHIKRHSPIGR